MYRSSHRPQVCNFIKKETLVQVFSCEFREISKNTFSYRTPPGDCFYLYPDGPMQQEEATEIRKRLEKEDLIEFTASNRWLKSWKKRHGIREARLSGETYDDTTATGFKKRAWAVLKGP